MLGAVVFVLAPRVRSALAGLATEGVVVAGLFLPFVLAGEFRMFEYRWSVNGDTLLSLVVEPGTRFTWAMRVLQGALALGVGAALAWQLRHTMHAVWVAPLGAVAVRLALDPVRYPWYWLAVETLALLGAAEFLTARSGVIAATREGLDVRTQAAVLASPARILSERGIAPASPPSDRGADATSRPRSRSSCRRPACDRTRPQARRLLPSR